MKTNVVCVIAFIALVNGIDGIHAQPTISETLRQTRSIENSEMCVSGETKMEDCNKCFCIIDGSGWACTRKLCESAIKMNIDGTIDQPNQNNPLNLPVEGIYAQPTISETLRQTRSIENLETCVPGETKMEDCNKCFCIIDGSGWACTRRLCESAIKINKDGTTDQPSQDNPPLNRAVRDASSTCVPNSRFKMDCNWCICTPDGRTAACTLIGCNSDHIILIEPQSS